MAGGAEAPRAHGRRAAGPRSPAGRGSASSRVVGTSNAAGSGHGGCGGQGAFSRGRRRQRRTARWRADLDDGGAAHRVFAAARCRHADQVELAQHAQRVDGAHHPGDRNPPVRGVPTKTVSVQAFRRPAPAAPRAAWSASATMKSASQASAPLSAGQRQNLQVRRRRAHAEGARKAMRRTVSWRSKVAAKPRKATERTMRFEVNRSWRAGHGKRWCPVPPAGLSTRRCHAITTGGLPSTRTQPTHGRHASIYDFEALSITGKPAQFVQPARQGAAHRQHRQRLRLHAAVQGAWSSCGSDYAAEGLVVVGFPSNEFGAQDPGSNE